MSAKEETTAWISQAPSDMEKLARWMIANSFTTGHGDTMDDLLAELDGEVMRLREKAHEGEATP